MVDSITAQPYDGARNYAIKLTNISDGTGEVLVKKVDVSTMNPSPGAHMKCRRIVYSIGGGGVALYWEGTPNTLLAVLAEGNGTMDFSETFSGGFPDPATSPTGNVLLSTGGFVANSGYTIEIQFIKGVSLN